MERFLESPGKRFLSPGKPWNLVFASPGKSWKKDFECLYDLLLRREHQIAFALCMNIVLAGNSAAL